MDAFVSFYAHPGKTRRVADFHRRIVAGVAMHMEQRASGLPSRLTFPAVWLVGHLRQLHRCTNNQSRKKQLNRSEGW